MNEPLATLVGHSPRAEIVLSMHDGERDDYTVTDLAKLTNFSRTTIYRHIDILLDIGVLTISGARHGGSIYTLDRDSSVVRGLVKLRTVVEQETLA